MVKPTTTTYAELARILHPSPPTPVPSMNVWKTNLALWCFGALARMAMTRDVVPTACHHTEMLLRYFNR